MKIAIIGTGVYSTALAYLMQKKKDNDIYLWTENKELVKKFKKTKKFEFLSKKHKFNSNVFLSSDLNEVCTDASVIFILVGSKFFKQTVDNLKPYYKKNTPILVGTKGMDLENRIFFSDYTRKNLKCNSYSFFAGPTFATELILNEPTYFTIAGSNKIGYRKLEQIFPEHIEYTYIDDLYGLELCSVLKNIYAIGSGILTGQNVSEGVYYGYMTKIIQEVELLIKKTYGNPSTLLTYGGIGDLLMTANCKTSRNFTLGTMIGANENQDEIESYIQSTTLEGYESLKEIQNLLEKWKIKDSIIKSIYDIVYKNKSCKILYDPQAKEKSQIV